MRATQSVCSFCGNERAIEDCFYFAPGPRICRECLQLCADILAEERTSREGLIASPFARGSICRSEQGRVIEGPAPLRICEACVADGWGALRGAG